MDFWATELALDVAYSTKTLAAWKNAMYLKIQEKLLEKLFLTLAMATFASFETLHEVGRQSWDKKCHVKYLLNVGTYFDYLRDDRSWKIEVFRSLCHPQSQGLKLIQHLNVNIVGFC